MFSAVCNRPTLSCPAHKSWSRWDWISAYGTYNLKNGTINFLIDLNLLEVFFFFFVFVLDKIPEYPVSPVEVNFFFIEVKDNTKVILCKKFFKKNK